MPTPIRFVLVHPRTPENLGAAARAQELRTWVRPPWNPDDPRARTLAEDAEDVLASTRLAGTLEEAVADCPAARAEPRPGLSWTPTRSAIGPEGTSSRGAQPGTDANLRRLATLLEELLLAVRFVLPGRAGVGPGSFRGGGQV